MNEFNKIIKAIGEELNIKVTLLSDNWTTVLEKDHQINYITGYHFDLNNHAIGSIMDDKGLFYDLLKYKNIPVIEQYIVFNGYNKDDIVNYFNSHQQKIVVKGNIGSNGTSVFKIENIEELFKVVDQLLIKQYSISLCPYYQIKNEYRVIVLDNEARLVFGKRKPVIIGDGIHSIKELAIEYNKYYIKHIDEIKNPNDILKKDEVYELSFKFNLSSGGKIFTDIDIILKDKITNLALSVSKNLNITFASIDIIHTIDDQIMVLEANSGVMMNSFIIQHENGYNIAYQIYRDAIKLMFKR